MDRGRFALGRIPDYATTMTIDVEGYDSRSVELHDSLLMWSDYQELGLQRTRTYDVLVVDSETGGAIPEAELAVSTGTVAADGNSAWRVNWSPARAVIGGEVRFRLSSMDLPARGEVHLRANHPDYVVRESVLYKAAGELPPETFVVPLVPDDH